MLFFNVYLYFDENVQENNNNQQSLNNGQQVRGNDEADNM